MTVESTKERILETALTLFARNGYLGTSMSDIAGALGITKAALYKHYAGKQEILDRIVERMRKMDYARAAAYEMPETEPDGFAEAYMHTPVGKIYAYSMAQFDHWTREPFSANFRRMLTLEQYRDPKLAQLHRDYLAGRAAGVHGSDLPQADGYGRGGHAAGAGLLRADVPALQRLRRRGGEGDGRAHACRPHQAVYRAHRDRVQMERRDGF